MTDSTSRIASGDSAVLLHILRNPWGHSQDDLRRAQLRAADMLESLSAATPVQLPEPENCLACARLARPCAEHAVQPAQLQVSWPPDSSSPDYSTQQPGSESFDFRYEDDNGRKTVWLDGKKFVPEDHSAPSAQPATREWIPANELEGRLRRVLRRYNEGWTMDEVDRQSVADAIAATGATP